MDLEYVEMLRRDLAAAIRSGNRKEAKAIRAELDRTAPPPRKATETRTR